MPRPRSDEWLSGEVASWRLAGVNRVVSLLEPHESRELGLGAEKKLCEENGLTFTSFLVQDRGVPSSLNETVGLVRSIHDDLLQGEGVAIHCRAGIGRSGLIAGCVLINLRIPEDEVFPRITRARGVKVPDTPEQIAWLTRFARERKNAL
jgi:protein-tyrosine phosphatase